MVESPHNARSFPSVAPLGHPPLTNCVARSSFVGCWEVYLEDPWLLRVATSKQRWCCMICSQNILLNGILSVFASPIHRDLGCQGLQLSPAREDLEISLLLGWAGARWVTRESRVMAVCKSSWSSWVFFSVGGSTAFQEECKGNRNKYGSTC